MFTLQTLNSNIYLTNVYSVNIIINPPIQGIKMIKISKLTIFGALLIAIPAFSADMVFEKKDNILLKGKIATVKTSKKYRNLEACQALCESRSSCAAYTLDTNKGSCSIFKNVSKEVSNSNATSGIKQ